MRPLRPQDDFNALVFLVAKHLISPRRVGKLHALSDDDSSTVCKRMKERNIPFVTYSGYDPIGGVCREGMRVMKPASMSLLVATVKGLLSERQISTQMTNWRALIDYACAQPSASPLT